MLLADMGADVIRVERREGGEDRAPGPITARGEGGMFHNLNRNKRGMTLDLGRPESADVVKRLVSTADVVIANLPIKVLRKVGLDYETLKRHQGRHHPGHGVGIWLHRAVCRACWFRRRRPGHERCDAPERVSGSARPVCRSLCRLRHGTACGQWRHRGNPTSGGKPAAASLWKSRYWRPA